uniref:Uncharacterized protein n=1 Tax=Lygus hesperus TaxID=30085 RepID=A0A146M0D0_LYGHE
MNKVVEMRHMADKQALSAAIGSGSCNSFRQNSNSRDNRNTTLWQQALQEGVYQEVDIDAADTVELLPLHLNNFDNMNNSSFHRHHQSYYVSMHLATVMKKTKHCGKHFE